MDQPIRLFFNGLAHKWNDETAYASQSRLPAIFNQYLDDLNGRILDVGSGAGVLIPVLQAYPGIEFIVEVDIAENMLKESKHIHNNVEMAHHVNASAMSIPTQNESFDHIIAFAVYPHLSSRDDALREFYRTLKPGGSLTILHLMGHRELNRMHREAHETVASHHLPSVELVSKSLEKTRLKVSASIERSDLFLIRAYKY